MKTYYITDNTTANYPWSESITRTPKTFDENKCIFDALWAEELKKHPTERQYVWHLVCTCPKCSIWC